MSSESEDGEEYQSTQKGRGRKPKLIEDDLDEDIRNTLVADVVRFILSKDSSKLPIKKADISAKIVKDAHYKKYTTNILEMAQQRLSDVFGMTLIEVDAKTKGTYILTSPFSPTELEFINTKSVSQETESIVLMSTLSLIEISNGRIDIEKAFEALGKMGLEKLEYKDKNDKNEKYWEHLVRTHFQKQLYIRATKESGQGRDITFISAGFRTSVEIGRININKYIAKLFGDEMDDIRLKEIETEEADKEREQEHARAQTQMQSSASKQSTQNQTPTQRRKQTQVQSQAQNQSQTPTQKRKQSQVQSQVASQSSQASQCQSQSQSNREGATKKAKRG
jgi:hypothetical protein